MSNVSWKQAIVDAVIFGIFAGMLFQVVETLGHALHRANLTDSKQGAYIAPVPTHSELSLATHFVVGAQPPQAVFLCPSSGFACSMVSHGGIPSGMPSSNFIGSPTPHDLPPILANGRKLNTNNQEVGVS